MDKLALTLLSALMIGLGMFPATMVPMVQTGVKHVMALLPEVIK
jgi:hypothetical protein